MCVRDACDLCRMCWMQPTVVADRKPMLLVRHVAASVSSWLVLRSVRIPPPPGPVACLPTDALNYGRPAGSRVRIGEKRVRHVPLRSGSARRAVEEHGGCAHDDPPLRRLPPALRRSRLGGLSQVDAARRPGPTSRPSPNDTQECSYDRPARLRSRRWLGPTGSEPTSPVHTPHTQSCPARAPGLHDWGVHRSGCYWRRAAVRWQETFPIGCTPDDDRE